jgi:phosphoribosylanthranilate isomerase
MIRTKVCGLTREADLHAAVAAGADAVGVVVDVPVDTPREVDVARAVNVVAAAPPFVTTVLVTMPAAPDRAAELVGRVDPDAVQVHGDLPPDDLAYLRSKVPTRVMRAVDADDPETARRNDGVAGALLVDSPGPDGGGGTGRTHDWEATRDLATDLDSPVVLAGGLTPDNVAEAVRTVEPFAVDVASGVEREGGVKDHDALTAFVENARQPTAAP